MPGREHPSEMSIFHDSDRCDVFRGHSKTRAGCGNAQQQMRLVLELMREVLMVCHYLRVEARRFGKMIVPLDGWNSGFLSRIEQKLEHLLLRPLWCCGRLQWRCERQNQRDRKIRARFHQLSIVTSVRPASYSAGKKAATTIKLPYPCSLPGLKHAPIFKRCSLGSAAAVCM